MRYARYGWLISLSGLLFSRYPLLQYDTGILPYLLLSINLQHPSTSPLLQTPYYTTWQNPNPVQQISPLQQKISNKSVSPGYPIQLLRYLVLIETKQPSAQGELTTAVDDLLDQLKHKFDVVSGEMFSKCACLQLSISVFYALCSVLYHAIPGSS